MNGKRKCGVYILYKYTHTHTHTHSGMLLSHKKEQNIAICSNMDGLKDYHAKWSQPEKDKYHDITYVKLKSLSRVRLFVTPWTIQCLELSRPEYWNGLPFPSPGDLPNPGIEPRSPMLQADSLPAEPPGKPKSTGLGSPSLPQGIFLTQESNRGLLHCRRIPYQLSYQGSPTPPICGV